MEKALSLRKTIKEKNFLQSMQKHKIKVLLKQLDSNVDARHQQTHEGSGPQN